MPATKPRKKHRKQSDRYLKRLSEQDRRIQQRIRHLIILEQTEYLWRA